MFRLPFTFLFTGIVSFLLFHVLTLADFASWIGEAPRSPDGLFRVHLLVLGWATMIAMGAVYQLLNVVLQTTVYSEKLGFVHYALFTAGTTGLLIGFRGLDTMRIAVCAATAFTGIVLFAVNIGLTLRRARQWNAITVSTAAAIACLVLTGLSGMAMGLDFEYGWFGGIHERLFYTHMWLGTVGWFGLLITGFSYKMLPMFYLAHDFPTSLQRWILSVWSAATLCGALSFLAGWGIGVKLGFLLLAAAVLLYNAHITQLRSHRHKPHPGSGILWTVGAARALAVCTVAGAVGYAVYAGSLPDAAAPVAIWLYLYGWVALTILGYMSKIVPFLWWTHKYGPRVGKGKVPTMGQLLAERPLHFALLAVAAALTALLIGLGSGATLLTGIAGSALSVSALAYMLLVARVFTR